MKAKGGEVRHGKAGQGRAMHNMLAGAGAGAVVGTGTCAPAFAASQAKEHVVAITAAEDKPDRSTSKCLLGTRLHTLRTWHPTQSACQLCTLTLATHVAHTKKSPTLLTVTQKHSHLNDLVHGGDASAAGDHVDVRSLSSVPAVPVLPLTVVHEVPQGALHVDRIPYG